VFVSVTGSSGGVGSGVMRIAPRANRQASRRRRAPRHAVRRAGRRAGRAGGSFAHGKTFSLQPVYDQELEARRGECGAAPAFARGVSVARAKAQEAIVGVSAARRRRPRNEGPSANRASRSSAGGRERSRHPSRRRTSRRRLLPLIGVRGWRAGGRGPRCTSARAWRHRRQRHHVSVAPAAVRGWRRGTASAAKWLRGGSGLSGAGIGLVRRTGCGRIPPAEQCAPQRIAADIESIEDAASAASRSRSAAGRRDSASASTSTIWR